MPRKYSVEFKEKAVHQIIEMVRLESCSLQRAYTEVGELLGVSHHTLRAWYRCRFGVVGTASPRSWYRCSAYPVLQGGFSFIVDVGDTTIRWCCVNFYLEGAGPCGQLQANHCDVP